MPGILLAVLAVAVAGWLVYCGRRWGWGPFAKLHRRSAMAHAGNGPAFSPDKVAPLQNSPLQGKHLVFLGSSVTYGASADAVSFVDYIALRNGCTVTKEAVSGTTLADNGPTSYVARLQRMDAVRRADGFICQLSTNDAWQNMPLGAVADGFDAAGFDTKTVAGAIEYIIAAARARWGCPTVFYTNPPFESQRYADMVQLLYHIRQKWGIAVIDMYADAAFNAITDAQRRLYMADAIHPTRAGYLQWWTPYMEKALYDIIDE